MNKTNLVFDNYFGGDFILRCATNLEYSQTHLRPIVDRILLQSTTTDDYIDNYLSCDELQNTQAYAVMSERCRGAGHWMRIRRNLGDRCFKTYSDAGGVKIGNPGFTTVIRNGRGDGVTRCAVVAKDSWNNSFLQFQGVISGNEIFIFENDCGDKINSKLESGRYGVYSGEGFVVFEKWEEA